ncbi:hypothetical protein HMPREF9370_2233 [Neisseria wadsworthii 9715]|uniref:Uncharacterized protein n=1 Tax=Neisseria wadsworthii 9715 TaxID=1030841 RepID=G4CT23_9NEIS|nr:hypothetical protein HMPREF9370_2233 [Neisseria wadsworthii 9715]
MKFLIKGLAVKQPFGDNACLKPSAVSDRHYKQFCMMVMN